MRIRLLVGMAGPHGAWPPGDIVEWPDRDDALRLIAAGYAEAVDTDYETATAEPEIRLTSKGSKRKRG